MRLVPVHQFRSEALTETDVLIITVRQAKDYRTVKKLKSPKRQIDRMQAKLVTRIWEK